MIEDKAWPPECETTDCMPTESYPKYSAYPDRAIIINTNDADGNTVSTIFPRGLEYFAAKHEADIVQVVEDDVFYYAKGQWKALEDEAQVPQLSGVTNLRGSKSSTPQDPRKPIE